MVFCSDCENLPPSFLQYIHLLPDTMYYDLHSHVFRRPPQLLTLTKNLYEDANKENG